MTTKKIEELSEIGKVSEECGSRFIGDYPLRSVTTGDNVDYENGEGNRFDGEGLVRYVLRSQRNVNSQQRRLNVERDRAKEKLDVFVLQARCDKNALIERTRKCMAKMQAQIEELEADTQIALDAKKVKIARRREIIKDCQWTLDREIAYMQKCAGMQK